MTPTRQLPSRWEHDEVRLSPEVTLPLRATVRRRRWDLLPAAVRTAIEAAVSSDVVLASTAGTGFTAGFASRPDLADGTSIVVKAASTADDLVHGWEMSDRCLTGVRRRVQGLSP